MAVDKNGSRIRDMFAAISPRYDLLNHLLSLNIDRSWRRSTVRELDLAPSARVLDVCTGTGDLALALGGTLDPRSGGEVVGTDFTREMVALGTEKTAKRGVKHVRFAIADTMALPFADQTFDAVTVAFGIRNVSDLDRGLGEMHRVLRPGGKVAILEFSTPERAVVRRAYHLYFHGFLPRVAARISGTREAADAYRYLPASVGEFPPAAEFSRRLERCGFEAIRVRRLTFGIAAVHVGTRGARPLDGAAAPADAAARIAPH